MNPDGLTGSSRGSWCWPASPPPRAPD